ncbi:MAG: uroporphyrinogen decarboxylase family protein [Candidatus Hodarchaeota archaeon]
MNHKERFNATLERKPVDRPATWLGMPLSSSLEKMLEYFKVPDLDGLKRLLDDDLYHVDVPYHSPTADHVACAFDWTKEGQSDYEHRTLTTPGFFEDYTDPSKIDDFEWPDPSKYIKSADCKATVDAVKGDYAIMGALWSCHFQDVCAAFGMARAFVVMLKHPEMFKAVIDRITGFYLEANEIFLEATAGKLDCVLVGNDFGGQKGLMLSPRHIRKYALPGSKKIIDQAKSFGVKVIYHSCGSIFDIIPDLIDLGVDAIHPLQTLARDMEPSRLKREFGTKVSFMGGVDTQDLLVNGTPEQVRANVMALKDIFPTGLVISPSHEALMPDVNPENVKAIFEGFRN